MINWMSKAFSDEWNLPLLIFQSIFVVGLWNLNKCMMVTILEVYLKACMYKTIIWKYKKIWVDQYSNETLFPLNGLNNLYFYSKLIPNIFISLESIFYQAHFLFWKLLSFVDLWPDLANKSISETLTQKVLDLNFL